MNHEAHEEHKGSKSSHVGVVAPRRIRLASPLTATGERAMTETIGCAIRVHRGLGPRLP
jgi:hypothetical protein